MYSLERLVPIVCARILLIAIVFKNVDLPEALEPVRRTFPLVTHRIIYKRMIHFFHTKVISIFHKFRLTVKWQAFPE